MVLNCIVHDQKPIGFNTWEYFNNPNNPKDWFNQIGYTLCFTNVLVIKDKVEQWY